MILTRAHSDADIPFICNTWFRQAWRAVAKRSPNFETFADAQRAAMALLLSRAETRVAYLDTVPDEILGYSISESQNHTLHFIYVKKDYRGQGIGKLLLPEGADKFIRLTYRGNTDGKRFLRAKLPLAEFDPTYVTGLMARAAYIAHRLNDTHAAGGPGAANHP